MLPKSAAPRAAHCQKLENIAQPINNLKFNLQQLYVIILFLQIIFIAVMASPAPAL